MNPSFTCCVIGKNEARTLPRLLASLKEFQSRGGVVVYVDTGSMDGSAEVARSLGCVVHEEGERFIEVIGEDEARQINESFVVGYEPPVVAFGEQLFNFAAARNFCASLAPTDWVSFADADEAYTALDLDEIEKVITDPEVAHLEYEFVFAHDASGAPAVAFRQSKAYDRSRIQWNPDVIVHEILAPIPGAATGRPQYVPEQVFHLEHWQEPDREHRSKYLAGLAKSCYDHGGNDRNAHYFARELMYTGRTKSAIKEFDRHIAMQRWPAERAQSLVFKGDCLGRLNEPDLQAEAYHEAFHIDSMRRVALLRLAGFYGHNQNWPASAAYAAAALEIPYVPFYATDMAEYRELPHLFAYKAAGWMGNIPKAQWHLKMALGYAPFHPDCLRDIHFYFDYDPAAAPEGWMSPLEMLWLWENAAGKGTIAEVGSWKGRSTHALCSGAAKTGGIVYAVDHWAGSVGEDVQHAEAKADPNAVYRQFIENTKQFENLIVHREESVIAAQRYPEKFFDMIFLDASHDEESVRKDIMAWRHRLRPGGLFCGHDFSDGWPGVKKAVLDLVGQPDGLAGYIWFKKV